ncbi:MAG: hypothetical protein F6K41_26060 [Symploca sp. SIO3E6]|nr:hypothetical protein [Caldora sp. SIO3E6]
MLLAQNLGSDSILDQGGTTAKNIGQAWDTQWQDVLTGDLYGIITNVGTFFAVGTLLFFMVQWLRDLIEGEFTRPISALIWPFIVVLFLANNGAILSQLTLQVRGYMNDVNQQVLDSSLDLRGNYQKAITKGAVEEVVGSLLRPCQSLTGQQQINCLQEAQGKIKRLLDQYEDSIVSDTETVQWIEALKAQVESIVDEAEKGQAPELSFNALLGSTSQAETKSFLLSSHYAFQNLIEVAMLLTAALGPIAVGASLLPVGGKPIYAWLTGFFSFGIAKLSFSIIAGLAGRVLISSVSTVGSDSTWFMIFMAFLAPILALAIAIGGGVGVFLAITNTASWVTRRV